MESGMENIIDIAAKRALVEVPQRMLNSLRKNVPNLELEVGGGLSEDQKTKIQALSEDFRYDFVLTSDKRTRNIVCGAPKEEIQPEIIKILQEYRDICTVELWQGQSEASIKELRKAYW